MDLTFVDEVFVPDARNAPTQKQFNMILDTSFPASYAQLSPISIERAVRRAAARSYRLCSGVEESRKRWYQPRKAVLLADRASALPVNVRVYSRRPTEEEVIQFMEYEVNTDFDVNGLLWRATFFRSETELRMVYCICHGIADGLSLALISKNILDELRWMSKHANDDKNWDVKIDMKSFPDVSELPMYKVGVLSFVYLAILAAFTYLFGLWNLLTSSLVPFNYRRLHLSKPIEPFTLPAWHQGEKGTHVVGSFANKPRGTTIIDGFDLTPEQTEAVLSAARVHDATVTAGLLSSCSEAFLRIRKASVEKKGKLAHYPLPLVISLSVRHVVPREHQLCVGNYATLGFVPFSKFSVQNDRKTFWRRGRDALNVMKFTAQFAAEAAALGFLLVKRRWVKMSYLSPFRFCPIAVMNLGVAFDKLFGDSEFEDRELMERARGTVDADMFFSPQFSNACVTVNGRMFVTVSASCKHTSRETLAKYVQHVKESLLAQSGWRQDLVTEK